MTGEPVAVVSDGADETSSRWRGRPAARGAGVSRCRGGSARCGTEPCWPPAVVAGQSQCAGTVRTAPVPSAVRRPAPVLPLPASSAPVGSAVSRSSVGVADPEEAAEGRAGPVGSGRRMSVGSMACRGGGAGTCGQRSRAAAAEPSAPAATAMQRAVVGRGLVAVDGVAGAGGQVGERDQHRAGHPGRAADQRRLPAPAGQAAGRRAGEQCHRRQEEHRQPLRGGGVEPGSAPGRRAVRWAAGRW